MEKQYCEKYRHRKSVGDILSSRSMERLISVSEEIETELANVKNCPEPCEDGMVLISPPSWSPRRLRCPIVTPYCAYGIGLEGKMDSYLNKIMLNAGLPRRHIDNLDGAYSTEALTWASKWNFQGFLVLAGPSGAGKSFGAAWAVKEYLKSQILDPLNVHTWSHAMIAGENVMWCSANRIVHDRELASKAWNVTLLVLEDLGREGNTPTRRADVGDVLFRRYDAKLPTVVTTELPLSEIIRTYGLHTAQKLTEDENGEGYGGMITDCGNESVCPEYCESGEDNGELSYNFDDDDTFYFDMDRESNEENDSLEFQDID
jgi:hypothetical protein